MWSKPSSACNKAGHTSHSKDVIDTTQCCSSCCLLRHLICRMQTEQSTNLNFMLKMEDGWFIARLGLRVIWILTSSHRGHSSSTQYPSSIKLRITDATHNNPRRPILSFCQTCCCSSSSAQKNNNYFVICIHKNVVIVADDSLCEIWWFERLILKYILKVARHQLTNESKKNKVEFMSSANLSFVVVVEHKAKIFKVIEIVRNLFNIV
jgi:hypothetical protein